MADQEELILLRLRVEALERQIKEFATGMACLARGTLLLCQNVKKHDAVLIDWEKERER